MEHYFINNQKLNENEKYFSYTYKNIDFQFVSDTGLFSTGHVDYATNILLNNIEPKQGKILDLGCGFGVVGIVFSKCFGVKPSFSDINEKAIHYARLNAQNNQVNGDFFLSDGFTDIDGNFDTIITNPPIHAGKDILYRLYTEASKHLNKDGNFYLIVQKKHGANSTEVKLKEIFSEVITVYKKKGFFIFKCQNI